MSSWRHTVQHVKHRETMLQTLRLLPGRNTMCTASVCVYIMSICRHAMQHVKDGQTTLQQPSFTFHKTCGSRSTVLRCQPWTEPTCKYPTMQKIKQKGCLAKCSVTACQFICSSYSICFCNYFPVQSSLLRIILSFKLYELVEPLISKWALSASQWQL